MTKWSLVGWKFYAHTQNVCMRTGMTDEVHVGTEEGSYILK